MMLKYFLLLALLALLNACGDSPNVCGDGTAVEHEERSYCVYDTEAITEEGFRCPDAFQFEFAFREFTACSPSGTTPPASFEQFVRERLGLIVPVVDAGSRAEPALSGTLPILEILNTSATTGTTGCIRYDDGAFSTGTTSFENESARGPSDQSCVFVFFEEPGFYDEIYPDFVLISSDAWSLTMEGLKRNGRPISGRDPNDTLFTSADTFGIPGVYPFQLFAEDPSTDRRVGSMLESGTLEITGYDPTTREMSFALHVDREGEINPNPPEPAGDSNFAEYLECPDDTLCLDVRRFGPASAGRVFLVWFNVLTAFPGAMPEIGYEAPVREDATTIRIPLSGVQPPIGVGVSCVRDSQRVCDALATCPCTGSTQAGFGRIYFYSDEDGVVVPPFEEVSPNGVAPLVMTYSPESQTPPGSSFRSEFGSWIAPDGIEEGVRPGRIVEGTFDHVSPTPLRTFEIRLCDDPEDGDCLSAFHFS